MIKLFFLLPMIMCAIWWSYLNSKGYTVKDGLRGFAYILSFNTVVIAFFMLMIVVTH